MYVMYPFAIEGPNVMIVINDDSRIRNEGIIFENVIKVVLAIFLTLISQ